MLQSKAIAFAKEWAESYSADPRISFEVGEDDDTYFVLVTFEGRSKKIFSSEERVPKITSPSPKGLGYSKPRVVGSGAQSGNRLQRILRLWILRRLAERAHLREILQVLEDAVLYVKGLLSEIDAEESASVSIIESIGDESARAIARAESRVARAAAVARICINTLPAGDKFLMPSGEEIRLPGQNEKAEVVILRDEVLRRFRSELMSAVLKQEEARLESMKDEPEEEKTRQSEFVAMIREDTRIWKQANKPLVTLPKSMTEKRAAA